MEYNVSHWEMMLDARYLYIYPQENHFELGKLIFWQDEYAFCQKLLDDIQKGSAVIEIKSGSLVLQLGNKETREILLNAFDREIKNESLKNTLEKVKRGKLELKAEAGGVQYEVFKSVRISFHEPEAQKNIKSVKLNKKEQGKRKRSIWRSPTPPKDVKKVKDWERIYAQ